MARQVLLKLMDDIKHSMFFGIMADEYTDISKKELISVCFRTVNEKLEGSEHFIGFYEIPTIKSDTIVNGLKDAITRTQQPLHKLRAQADDGASTS